MEKEGEIEKEVERRKGEKGRERETEAHSKSPPSAGGYRDTPPETNAHLLAYRGNNAHQVL